MHRNKFQDKFSDYVALGCTHDFLDMHDTRFDITPEDYELSNYNLKRSNWLIPIHALSKIHNSKVFEAVMELRNSGKRYFSPIFIHHPATNELMVHEGALFQRLERDG